MRKIFIKTWEDTWPWVRYDVESNSMHCIICREFPTVGIANNSNIVNVYTLFGRLLKFPLQ
jgi:hypothetical protein